MSLPVTTDRRDVWRDLIRENFVALDIETGQDAFVGSVRTTDLGYLNVASVESRTQVCTRTPQLARHDDDVYLQVGLVARGAAVVQQDGREAVLAPGQFAIYETDRPFTWNLSGAWELLVFTWPRSSVRLHDTVTQSLTARCLGGRDGLGAIVGRLLRDLATAPPDLSLDGGLRLGDEIADLVATVGTETVRPTERQRTGDDLLQRVDDYIVEHLSDPNLGPVDVAAAHFISTRHLHRLFAGRGSTVTRRIQHLRLERSRLELVHPSGDARSITDIARRWGFLDLATFSRAFRSAYGCTPTECRAASRS